MNPQLQKYTIQICRTRTEFALVEVEAESPLSARRKAIAKVRLAEESQESLFCDSTVGKFRVKQVIAKP